MVSFLRRTKLLTFFALYPLFLMCCFPRGEFSWLAYLYQVPRCVGYEDLEADQHSVPVLESVLSSGMIDV